MLQQNAGQASFFYWASKKIFYLPNGQEDIFLICQPDYTPMAYFVHWGYEFLKKDFFEQISKLYSTYQLFYSLVEHATHP